MDGSNVVNLTVQILKEIRDSVRENTVEIRGMKTDIGEMRADIGEMKADIGEMKADIGEMKFEIAEMRVSIDQLTGRFDHFLEFGGERHRLHDARITRLETRVFGAAGGPPLRPGLRRARSPVGQSGRRGGRR